MLSVASVAHLKMKARLIQQAASEQRGEDRERADFRRRIARIARKRRERAAATAPRQREALAAYAAAHRPASLLVGGGEAAAAAEEEEEAHAAARRRRKEEGRLKYAAVLDQGKGRREAAAQRAVRQGVAFRAARRAEAEAGRQGRAQLAARWALAVALAVRTARMHDAFEARMRRKRKALLLFSTAAGTVTTIKRWWRRHSKNAHAARVRWALKVIKRMMKAKLLLWRLGRKMHAARLLGAFVRLVAVALRQVPSSLFYYCSYSP
jgi:hypothetical protein